MVYQVLGIDYCQISIYSSSLTTRQAKAVDWETLPPQPDLFLLATSVAWKMRIRYSGPQFPTLYMLQNHLRPTQPMNAEVFVLLTMIARQWFTMSFLDNALSILGKVLIGRYPWAARASLEFLRVSKKVEVETQHHHRQQLQLQLQPQPQLQPQHPKVIQYYLVNSKH